MTITQAAGADIPAIVQLLKANDLPVDDIVAGKQLFFIATNNGQPIGAIGLETHGSDGLLRSLVVDGAWRNRSVGRTLYNTLVDECAQSNISRLYLLTRTAQPYFERLGWQTIDRNAAPVAVRSSAEFAHLCPASAVCMHLALTR